MLGVLGFRAKLTGSSGLQRDFDQGKQGLNGAPPLE